MDEVRRLLSGCRRRTAWCSTSAATAAATSSRRSPCCSSSRPRRSRPSRSSSSTRPAPPQLTAPLPGYGAWRASIDEAVTTGSGLLHGAPALPRRPGQRRRAGLPRPGRPGHRRTVLLRRDIFAAGFQDHEIGPVMGVDANTGAGGANVADARDAAYGLDRRPAQAAAQGRRDARRAAPLPRVGVPLGPARRGPRGRARHGPRADQGATSWRTTSICSPRPAPCLRNGRRGCRASRPPLRAPGSAS